MIGRDYRAKNTIKFLIEAFQIRLLNATGPMTIRYRELGEEASRILSALERGDIGDPERKIDQLFAMLSDELRLERYQVLAEPSRTRPSPGTRRSLAEIWPLHAEEIAQHLWPNPDAVLDARGTVMRMRSCSSTQDGLKKVFRAELHNRTHIVGEVKWTATLNRKSIEGAGSEVYTKVNQEFVRAVAEVEPSAHHEYLLPHPEDPLLVVRLASDLMERDIGELNINTMGNHSSSERHGIPYWFSGQIPTPYTVMQGDRYLQLNESLLTELELRGFEPFWPLGAAEIDHNRLRAHAAFVDLTSEHIGISNSTMTELGKLAETDSPTIIDNPAARGDMLDYLSFVTPTGHPKRGCLEILHRFFEDPSTTLDGTHVREAAKALQGEVQDLEVKVGDLKKRMPRDPLDESFQQSLLDPTPLPPTRPLYDRWPPPGDLAKDPAGRALLAKGLIRPGFLWSLRRLE